MALSNNVALP